MKLMDKTRDLVDLICSLKSKNEVEEFVRDMFTPNEFDTLAKRWRIIKMLNEGYTQRDIAKELQVSLCKVTRGSKILKNKNSVIYRYLKEVND